ncbi:DUF3592 domain-containing protein [Mycobacterium crocinum]|uniref:DUF3592 domain-containing protein n=1 Tax=Mycolicibacterium crocinum TaxID=388459 RepID=A0ABY3TRV6_9MYCO|nr:DUF3592 domain-containing protein [Mycolicibacterium crocinum]MCV7217543.1 DUF3592 domain-containing protein [Mycolicibacterium crocinum]ULN44201.1 DUF3592 domain-containing protein [Mycolicibacterium crocinum]
MSRLLALLKAALPRRDPDVVDTTRRKVLRWSKCAVWILIGLVTLQSLLLVAGAWRNDRQIERNMGVAQAEVLSAGPRRSTIEFVTPDRVTYRPELGVLYPSELAEGMRIYVEYDRNNPDLVRVQHRTAALAIIPAGSIAVVAWLIGGLLLTGLVMVERRVNQVDISLDSQLLS